MSDTILTSAIDTVADATPVASESVQSNTGNAAQGTATQAEATKAEAKPEAKTEELIFGKFKTLEDATKAHKELEKGFHSRVAIPGENATKEERDAFFAKIGRPETVEGYEIPIPEDNPAEATFFKGLAEKAHELGLTKAQMAGLMEFGNGLGGDYTAAKEAEAIETAKQTTKMLQSKWGVEYKDNLEVAAKAGVNLLGKDAFARLMEGPQKLGSNPEIIEMFYRVGKQISEDSISDKSRSSVAKEDAAAARLSIMSNKNDPLYEAYRKPSHPQHAAAVKRVDELSSIVFED